MRSTAARACAAVGLAVLAIGCGNVSGGQGSGVDGLVPTASSLAVNPFAAPIMAPPVWRSSRTAG